MQEKVNKKLPLITGFLMCLQIVYGQVFTEKSVEIGIEHSYAARGLMGGGAAFFDYDNDGDEDLYLTNGLQKDHFYINNGDGSFTKVLSDIGLNITQFYNTIGVTTGDIDNDGDRDIFVATWEKIESSAQPDGRHLLFLNNGDGTFTEIGESAGIIQEAFALGASFLDFDRDGYLDIYTLNYVKTPMFTYDDNGVINGYAHECYANFLYKNNGDLTFSEVAMDYGMNNAGCTMAAMPTDYDTDGDLDLYLANDFGEFIIPNILYQNQYPDFNFIDVSEESASNIGLYGMGIAGGDYDHDQDLDYYITNLGRNVLLENNSGVFEDATTFAGVENIEVPGEGLATSWGTAFFDVDNDTWEDIFVANGRIPGLPAFPTAMSDPNKLYMNNGDKTFEDVTENTGLGDPFYGRGMAYSDFDLDGDLDMVVVVLDELGGQTKFYVNETENDNNYVQIKLEGKESNRDAFGSKIWLFSGEETFLREIYGGGSSHASQHSSIAHFGLGSLETIDSIRIEWINGHIDTHSSLEINNLYIFEEDIETNTHQHLNSISTVQITPNPFNTHITISLDSNIQKECSIKLTSIEGKTLWNKKVNSFNGKIELNFESSLPNGMYLIQIQMEQEFFTKKIIKN